MKSLPSLVSLAAGAVLLSAHEAPAGAAPAKAPAAPPTSFRAFERRAQSGARLNVVFFGASLTWGANASDPLLTSYRANVARRMEQLYPKAHLKFWDGAIGGTGSQLGVFRLNRDVLQHKPDLVFLDFTANDDIYDAAPDSLATYESIVRRLVLQAQVPVVQVMFPFKWNVKPGELAKMKRRDAHTAISRAYHTGLGDAVKLANDRVEAGTTTLDVLWPFDGVHPGNKGYELFADAAWQAYRTAVAQNLVCKAPATMLNADTYMKNARVRLSSLVPLPAGWSVGTANRTSAYFDFLMSRWLDDETIASNMRDVVDADGKKHREPQAVERFKATFNGSTILFFGETTAKSGKYRVYIDGQLVPHELGNKQPAVPEYDMGDFARRINGNGHYVQLIAKGLDTAVSHTLEIEPVFEEGKDQELRLESICVAGGAAVVSK